MSGARPSLTVTDQCLASATATVSIGKTTTTPSGFWRKLTEQLDDSLRLATLSLTDGCADLGEYRTRLEKGGVTALDGLYVTACSDVVSLAAGAHERLQELTAALGSGQTPVNLRSSFEDILTGPIALLRLAVDVRPSIEVQIHSTFREIRRDQREQVCRLVSELSQAADVRLVASVLTQRYLRKEHRGDLPSFSLSSNPQRTSPSLDELVETAREEIDPESTEVVALRVIADEPTETLSYKALKSDLPVSDGRVSQLLGRLEDLGLVERFGPRTEKQVELTKAGTTYLSSLERDIGRQSELDAEFSETGKSYDNVRVIPNLGRQVDDPADHENISQVRSLDRTDAVAAHATAVDSGIGLVDYPVQKLDDGRTPLWWYDEDADRLVVGAEYHRPHQYLTCIARSLASGLTFNRVLTPERLDGEVGGLGGLALDDPNLLRRAACLGWLKDKDTTGEAYVKRLDEAREDVLDLTRQIHRKVESGSGSECGPLYAQLGRDAKGLIGTLLHLLRLLDVEVVFQLRLPRFNQDYNDDRREQLTRMLSRLVGPASAYGHFSVQRVLFEGREEKRESAIVPDVDAADPFGALMPSFSIVGPGVTRLTDSLEAAFEDHEPHEDAPEMAVRVPLEDRTHVREAHVEATRVMCRAKDLQPTREAVSVLQALCGSPYDVADALQALGQETKSSGRSIRAHDLRYALSTLSPKRLLPDLPPTVGKIVSGLLGVAGRVTQTELADLADVSARSLRNNRELLEVVSLLDVDQDGYRLALSFADERQTDVFPELVTSSIISISDVSYELLCTTIEDVDHLSDPDNSLGECFYWPPDMATLCNRVEDTAPWICLAASLLGETLDDPETLIATLGPSIEQVALHDAVLGTPEVAVD